MRKLDLFVCPITDFGLAHIAGLRQLQELNLGDTKVTGAGVKKLGSLGTMKTLYLFGVNISAQDKAELMKTYPKLEFFD